MTSPHRELLPFPIEHVFDAQGRPARRYLIPPEKRAEVLKKLWLFAGDPPALDEEMVDIHENKNFRVGEFQVFREGNLNCLASPYYLNSGGTVIDWWPVDESKLQQEPDDGLVEELLRDIDGDDGDLKPEI